MRIVCFIGSGFNYLSADIVRSQNIYTKDDVPLHEEVIRLNRLWGHLDLLLSPFNNIFPTKYGEELLEAIAGTQKLYNKFIGKCDSLHSDTAEFSARIKESMKQVGEQFIRFEANGGYSKIHQGLPNLGKEIQNLLSANRIESLYLCTTNYDGIIDSLLTYYCENDSKRKFVLKDGFIHGHFNNWVFKHAKYKIAHLHGSYKYNRGLNGTIKLNKGAHNYDPVMIYDDPNCKMAAIIEDSVLSANFLELKRQLEVCDKVITIGNSFKSEPHLLELIKSTFNRPKTQLVICSNKPEEVESMLEPYYSFPIHKQSTKQIKSEEELVNLFHQLFSSAGLDILATA